MAWGDTRDAAQDWTSTNVPNYQGSAYGMNQPPSPNWASGWSPTGQMSNRVPASTTGFGYDRSGTTTGNLGGRNYRNIELANRRGIATLQDEDEGMGMVGNAKQALSGFKWPSFMMADSIVKNQAQHKDLDKYFQSTYGDDWRNAKNASFFNKQGFRPGLDWESLSNRNNPNRDISGLSGQGKQAMTKFSLAGITDQVMAKFMDPTYKFGGNEAWLRSQASDNELFDEGMSLIKNARDTSELHGMMSGQQRSAADDYYEKGEHWDIAPDSEFAPGQGYKGNEYDLENQIKLLENQTFPGGDDITDDITDDIDYDEYERGEMMPDERYSTWEDPGFYNVPLSTIRGAITRKKAIENPNLLRKFADLAKRNSGFIGPRHRNLNLTPPGYDADEIFEDEEIMPNILDPDYFNQFTPG